VNFDPVSYIMGTKSGGHGSGPTLETLKVQENGVITAPNGVAWNQVEADVPNTYSAADEGMVVSGGALVEQGAATVGVNGTIDTTEIGALTVAVAPYTHPFVSPLHIQAAGALELEVILWYNNLGIQISGATFGFDGTTWSRVRKDGLGTFEVVADADNPSVGIITAEPPSGGTVIRRAYSYVS